jgi:hypothetical protein
MNTKCNRFLILVQEGVIKSVILTRIPGKNVAFHYLI